MTPRRWFRFSLRTGFVLVTLLCVWVGVQMNWLRHRREARAWVQEQGGLVLERAPIDLAINGGKANRVDPSNFQAPWPIRLLGGEPVGFIVLHDAKGNAAKLSKLFPEAKIVVIPARYDVHKAGVPNGPSAPSQTTPLPLAPNAEPPR